MKKRTALVALKIFFTVFLIFITLAGCVWADDAEAVKVDVLAKTGSSWDGQTLSD